MSDLNRLATINYNLLIYVRPAPQPTTSNFIVKPKVSSLYPASVHAWKISHLQFCTDTTRCGCICNTLHDEVQVRFYLGDSFVGTRRLCAQRGKTNQSNARPNTGMLTEPTLKPPGQQSTPPRLFALLAPKLWNKLPVT